MEHLQTPVTVEPYDSTLNGPYANVVNRRGQVIAYQVDMATARCFAKAVNCHDDLLEACQRANNCLETHGKIDSGTTLHRIIAAAIAKAEEKP